MMEEIGKAGGQMAMQLISGLMKGLAGGAGAVAVAKAAVPVRQASQVKT